MPKERIYHNSFELQYRKPFGAIPINGRIALFLYAKDVDNVILHLWKNEKDNTIMPGTHSNDMYGFEITAPNLPGLIWYYFEIMKRGERIYYGAHNGIGEQYACIPPAYQITVYDREKYPKKKDVCVCYQIFPDRFCRHGEKGGIERVSAHTNRGMSVYIHEDWKDEVLTAPLPGNDVYSPCDFFGGDLFGIADMLEYIDTLCVTRIYLNPIFDSASNHRYDTGDYEKVDEILGGEEGLAVLSKKCEEHGIELMLDGVFSHTGADSVYFNKYSHYNSCGAYNSQASPYYSWYEFFEYPEQYRCWWNFPTLPEVRETTPAYMSFIAGVISSYFERYGICAWRLDVADELPDSFIAMLRKTLNALSDKSTLIGEVWEDASNKKAYDRRRAYVDGGMLDGVMNYPFRATVSDFLTERISAERACLDLYAQCENYPPEFLEACMTILGSHDTPRIITALSGRVEDGMSAAAKSQFRLSAEEKAIAAKRLRLAAILQFAYVGIPCIYYGDELGMEGFSDPFCRRTFTLDNFDADILEFFRALCKFRRNILSLSLNSIHFSTNCVDLLTFSRQTDANVKIYAVVNRSKMRYDISVKQPEGLCFCNSYTDILTNNIYTVMNGELVLAVGGMEGLLLVGNM